MNTVTIKILEVTSTMLPTQWEIHLSNGMEIYGRAEYKHIMFRDENKGATFYSKDLEEELTWYPLFFMLTHLKIALKSLNLELENI